MLPDSCWAGRYTKPDDPGRNSNGNCIRRHVLCYNASGSNDCANLSGTHSCAGQSKLTMDAGEWKYVAKGTCSDMKGMTADAAKAKVKMMTEKKG